MVSRCRQLSAVGLTALLLLAVACEKVPLVAPSGSTITLSAPTNALSTNGSTEIVGQVLEAAGVPPHSGTHVTFTTTLGRIEPAEAETDASGRVVVRFVPNGQSGTAIINATSGGATTGATGALRISVGSAGVGSVRVGASPASVSSFGGSSTISASILDFNGNPLAQVPVAFTTTAGTLSSSLVMTDAAGIAQTVLSTSQQATITASVGAQGGSSTSTPTTPTTPTTPGTTTPTTPTPAPAPSTGQASGTVTVTVIPAASLVITPPTTSPSAGIPSTYRFAVTVPANGAAVRSLRVDWGDGSTQDLGAVTGNADVQHTYRSTGNFKITGTLTDASGNVITVSSAVSVIVVASPIINITPSVPSSCTGSGACNVTFLIQVTPPTGVGIVSTTVNFGNQAVPSQTGLGGLSGSATVQAQYPAHAGSQTIVVTVTDTLERTTQGFTTINIP